MFIGLRSGLTRAGGKGLVHAFTQLGCLAPRPTRTERKLQPQRESDLPKVTKQNAGKGYQQPGQHSGTFLTCCSTAGLLGSKGNEVSFSSQYEVDENMLGQEVQPKCSMSGAGRYPFGSVIRVKMSFESDVGKWRR